MLIFYGKSTKSYGSCDLVRLEGCVFLWVRAHVGQFVFSRESKLLSRESRVEVRDVFSWVKVK